MELYRLSRESGESSLCHLKVERVPEERRKMKQEKLESLYLFLYFFGHIVSLHQVEKYVQHQLIRYRVLT